MNNESLYDFSKVCLISDKRSTEKKKYSSVIFDNLGDSPLSQKMVKASRRPIN